MTQRPTLHLTVGLPGVGKTTLAHRLAAEQRAVRFTPDDWMLPLYGENDPYRRDVVEGRLLWTTHEVLRGGASVVVDFGCWSAEERWAVRAIAEHAGAAFVMHVLDLPEAERRARIDARWESDPTSTFEMTTEDHDQHVTVYQPPTVEETAATILPGPPPGHASWLAWAADRWPSLTDLGSSTA